MDDEGNAVKAKRVEADASPATPVLTPPAKRALAEAEARRLKAADETKAREYNGRGGLEPVRFGDWEVKGIATDF